MLQSSGFEFVDSQELLIRFCRDSLGIVINQPYHLQLSDKLILDADVRVHRQFDQKGHQLLTPRLAQRAQYLLKRVDARQEVGMYVGLG